MSCKLITDAIDLSHHLSENARARSTPPLNRLERYYGRPGIITLAEGLPHPNYFPFASVGGEALCPTSYPINKPGGSSAFSWLWKLFSTQKTVTFQIPKYTSNPRDLNLAQGLQYGMVSGLPDLQTFTAEFTRKVYNPNYANFATLLHTGNTDGWAKAALLLCNPGEGVLVEEWTYPSAVAMMEPFNIKPIAVPMDGQGVLGSGLRRLLEEWDKETRGMSRPHVFYTIPTGQNPTGSTTPAARKQEIYNICAEFDIIIVEDDPYYFLQQAAYVRPSNRTRDYESVPEDDEEFLSRLSPSYLRFDYQGRVIRLDTFSKTIAPGCRLGWFTCNPLFAQRLKMTAEAMTLSTCGFSQTIIAKVLQEWQFSGYLRWLKGLRLQYQTRRDFLIDCIHHEFDVQLENTNTSGFHQGLPVYMASLKRPNKFFSEKQTFQPVLSFIPPSAGMIKIFFNNHPSFSSTGSEALEMKLWVALAEAGLLLSPGNWFAGEPGVSERTDGAHFRMSFSTAEFEDMRKGVQIFSAVLTEFYTTLQ